MQQMKQFLHRIKAWSKEHKKPLLISGGVLVLALISFSIFRIFGNGIGVERITNDGSGEANEQTLELVTSPTTGQQVIPEVARRPVIGVMISNSSDARPQSGIDNADIVFEAIAEGGITRYLALFHDQEAPTIGPVRSLRPYYIDWIKAFDATAVHVGGSQEALNEAADRLQNRDIDEFRYGASVFERIPQRRAPHNTYTSFKKLLETARQNGHDSSSFEQLIRQDPQPPADGAQNLVTSISIPFSSASYHTKWSYSRDNNLYKRSIAGQAHIDDATDSQIAVNAVVAIKTTYNTFTARGNTYNDPKTTGTGTAYIFQNGTATEVNWSRSSNGQYQFTDQSGETIELNTGKLWLAVTPSGQKVSYE